MKKILMATGNQHKFNEVKDILTSLNFNYEIISLGQLDMLIEEPLENGTSFKENSYIKAKYYHDLSKLPTIADDSGICIDFYNGKPGIYSARWMNGLAYEKRNKKIIEEMKDSDNRKARFICGITFIDDDKTFYYEGVLNGKIADAPYGNKGFGYDPIFVVDGQNKTLAQLGEEYKKYHSHRALALRRMVQDFEK